MAYLPNDPDCPYQVTATLHLGFGPRMEALLGAGPLQLKKRKAGLQTALLSRSQTF